MLIFGIDKYIMIGVITLTEEINTSPSGRRARSSEPFAEMIVMAREFHGTMSSSVCFILMVNRGLQCTCCVLSF